MSAILLWDQVESMGEDAGYLASDETPNVQCPWDLGISRMDVVAVAREHYVPGADRAAISAAFLTGWHRGWVIRSVMTPSGIR